MLAHLMRSLLFIMAKNNIITKMRKVVDLVKSPRTDKYVNYIDLSIEYNEEDFS